MAPLLSRQDIVNTEALSKRIAAAAVVQSNTVEAGPLNRTEPEKQSTLKPLGQCAM